MTDNLKKTPESLTKNNEEHTLIFRMIISTENFTLVNLYLIHQK